VTAGQRPLGILLVAASAASFGTLAIFARLAYDTGADPIAVLFLRFTVAAALMAGLMVVRRESWPRGRTLGALVLLGGVGYVGQSMAFFTALTMAPAALVSLLLYLFPAIVVLLSVAFLGERLTRAKRLALALALAGSALTVGAASGGRPLGIVLGLAAAVTYSVYIVIGSRVTPRAGAIPSSTVIIGAAAVTYGLLTLVARPAFPTGLQGALAVGGLAVVATVVAIVTFFAGMSRIGPADTSTVSTLEPAVTVALAAVVLGEPVLPPQLAGGALILTAVVLLARARTSRDDRRLAAAGLGAQTARR
jgi:drug/metabolite transporter (DMT)-like permease